MKTLLMIRHDIVRTFQVMTEQLPDEDLLVLLKVAALEAQKRASNTLAYKQGKLS